jgi:small conductance mechanosensitive channel
MPDKTAARRRRSARGLTLTLFAALLALGLAGPLPGPQAAAQTPPAEDAAAEETDAAPADAAAEEGAAEEGAAEEAPTFADELLDPATELEIFQLRLIPLTLEELSALAAEWQGITKDLTERVVEATIVAQRKGADATAEELERVVDLTQQRRAGFDRYTSVIDSLQNKGGDEAEVATYRAYRSAIVVEETQRADWRTLMNRGLAWAAAPDGGLGIAIDVAIVVAAFLGLLVVARMLKGFARRMFGRVPNLSKLLQAFLAVVVYWLAIAIGLMIVLAALGVNITPLFALVGGASFIVAFAMQDTLGNLAAGLMIMLNRPFDEGDYITAGGTSGTVAAVSIVSTMVRTPDNQVIYIPNSKVWGDVITNATASELRRLDLEFGIDYGDDADAAIDTILEIARADPRVLDDPEPWVRLTNLGESSVDLTARLWCRADDYWELKFALTKAVKTAFDARGITIPYPHSVEITRMEA